MDALGYGLAWRVLDAQFFGVAQRRERVFLVGSLGTMRCAEVLFERESLSWDHQSSRQKRQALAEEAQGCVGEADHDSGRLTPGETQSRRVYPTSGVYPTLSTREKSGQNQESVFTQFGDDVAGTLTARYDSSPCVDPVSYTHLDVYKRQTLTTASIPLTPATSPKLRSRHVITTRRNSGSANPKPGKCRSTCMRTRTATSP